MKRKKLLTVLMTTAIVASLAVPTFAASTTTTTAKTVPTVKATTVAPKLQSELQVVQGKLTAKLAANKKIEADNTAKKAQVTLFANRALVGEITYTKAETLKIASLSKLVALDNAKLAQFDKAANGVVNASSSVVATPLQKAKADLEKATVRGTLLSKVNKDLSDLLVVLGKGTVKAS